MISKLIAWWKRRRARREYIRESARRLEALQTELANYAPAQSYEIRFDSSASRTITGITHWSPYYGAAKGDDDWPEEIE